MKAKNDAIYGAIAGDVIGSAYEFKGARYEPIQLFKQCCQFTDDTVLTVAVADWLTHADCNLQDMLIQYARKYAYAGYGSSFAKWVRRKNHQPYNSCGNGSAMRVSAVGCIAKSLVEALQLAKESAIPTHNHPEGVKGAQATAAAIYLARQGKNKEEIKAKLKELFDYNLDRSYAELCQDVYEFHVLCQTTVPEALICFFESESYEECIRMAMLTNMDTDTAACIAGSVAAAYYGMPDHIKTRLRDFIPEDFIHVVESVKD
jgi:ADP-ribosylglycohydrolase